MWPPKFEHQGPCIYGTLTAFLPNFKSRVPITTIFVSDLRWEHMRPSLGAAPDPYYIDVQSSSKQGHFTAAYRLFP